MARTFDGVDDQINFGTGADLDLTTYTATAWVKFPSTHADERQILAKTPSDYAGIKQYLQMQSDAGQNRFQMYSARDTTAAQAQSVTDALTAGVWNFIATSWDGSGLPKIYCAVHGTPAAEPGYAIQTAGSGAERDSSGGSLRLGTRDSLNTYWTGELADVRLYNVQLSLPEIIAIQYGLHPQPAALAFHAPVWGLQDPEIDMSAASRTGTVTGTTVFAGDPPRTLWTRKWITVDNTVDAASSARPSLLLTGVG